MHTRHFSCFDSHVTINNHTVNKTQRLKSVNKNFRSKMTVLAITNLLKKNLHNFGHFLGDFIFSNDRLTCIGCVAIPFTWRKAPHFTRPLSPSHVMSINEIALC
jgi:hypothetical protein